MNDRTPMNPTERGNPRTTEPLPGAHVTARNSGARITDFVALWSRENHVFNRKKNKVAEEATAMFLKAVELSIILEGSVPTSEPIHHTLVETTNFLAAQAAPGMQTLSRLKREEVLDTITAGVARTRVPAMVPVQPIVQPPREQIALLAALVEGAVHAMENWASPHQLASGHALRRSLLKQAVTYNAHGTA